MSGSGSPAAPVDQPHPSRVLVIGAGAVGLGVLSCLHKGGAPAALVGRSTSIAGLRRHGLHRTGVLGEHRIPPEVFAPMTGTVTATNVAGACLLRRAQDSASGAGTDRDQAVADAGAHARDADQVSREAGAAHTNLAMVPDTGAGTITVYPDLAAAARRTHDLLVVCVKAFDSTAVTAQLAAVPALAARLAAVVLLQNGYGSAAIFARAVPPERVLCGRVITGFRRPEPHRVEVTVHAAPVHIAAGREPAAAHVKAFCAALTRGDLPARPVADIEPDLWAKLLYNAMLNPLGALLNATYGELGNSARARAVMERIAEECCQVLAAAGKSTHWDGVEDYLRSFYDRMLPPTRGHESSMLQSIRARQPTEIDAINGAIVRLGRDCDVPTPTNALMVELVHLLEESGPGTGGAGGVRGPSRGRHR